MFRGALLEFRPELSGSARRNCDESACDGKAGGTKWNVERLEHLTTLPDRHTTATTDAIEESATPNAGLQPDKTHDEIETATLTGPRRLTITRDDLETYGYSD